MSLYSNTGSGIRRTGADKVGPFQFADNGVPCRCPELAFDTVGEFFRKLGGQAVDQNFTDREQLCEDFHVKPCLNPGSKDAALLRPPDFLLRSATRADVVAVLQGR